MSYGASVLVIAPPMLSVRPSGVTSHPCCDTSARIVSMSASRGTRSSTSRSSVSIPAAINGNAAFFAPPMVMLPCNGFPPRIRIRSITGTLRTGPWVPSNCYIRGKETPRWPMYLPALSA